MDDVTDQKYDSVDCSSGFPDILSIDNAAKYLTISRYFLYMLVNKNVIPHARLGKRIVFRKVDLLEWVGSLVGRSVSDVVSETEE